MSDRHERKRVTVLLVGDDRAFPGDAAASLALRGFRVLRASNGPEAIETLKERSVDVLALDGDTSDLPAASMAQTACRMFPDLRVIVVLDEQNPDTVRAALASGASDFTAKPMDEARLLAAIERNVEKQTNDAALLCEERSETLFSTIRALAAAVDAKSRYTATHSNQVTGLCLSAGKALGLSAADMATLELAAQIHDIGNIGTPDEILDKPGRLTEIEWVDILRHPDVGSSMLSHIPALGRVASVIRHHHERFDGNGYPDGLRGEAIPLLSRIIAIADAYEAMTSDRSYRPARTHAEAVSELRANARAQFDPDVLEYFVAAVDDAEATRKAA